MMENLNSTVFPAKAFKRIPNASQAFTGFSVWFPVFQF
jgi:hypothetical protein